MFCIKNKCSPFFSVFTNPHSPATEKGNGFEECDFVNPSVISCPLGCENCIFFIINTKAGSFHKSMVFRPY